MRLGKIPMGLEIEAKFRVADPSALAAKIASLGWAEAEHAASKEEDLYFQGMGRDFRQTGEALRIRVQNGVPRFTYKGPVNYSEEGVKVREELEMEIPDAKPSEAQRFLEALGFQPMVAVHKLRRSFRNLENWPGFLITLDEVKDLGSFAEVEFLSDGNGSDTVFAAKKVADLAGSLGLTVRENRSYLRMLMGTG